MQKSTQIYQGIISDIMEEVTKASFKFPQWPVDMIHAAAIVAEEAGELSQAALQCTYEGAESDNAEKEAIQTACTAIRFLIAYRSEHYQTVPNWKEVI